MYSQFCYHIQEVEQKRRATMHIPRKPGEQIEVDWAGKPACIIDPDTGELTECWLFVGVLSYSQYTFVEAFLNEKTANWIKAHVHMYTYFGGVTPILVSDNCATAINRKQSDWYTPVATCQGLFNQNHLFFRPIFSEIPSTLSFLVYLA